ncbi:MAG: hypothetical protein ACPF8V_07145, partial [Luteibaculum sp.]
MQQKDRLPVLITGLISLILLAVYYGPMLWEPNSYMFSHSVDALKNYFAFAYYVQHNEGLSNFWGLNHPFGESFLLTDGHALVGLMVKGLGQLFPALTRHPVAILNLLLIVTQVLCPIFVFQILRHYGLKTPWTIFFSLLIWFLNPQIFRLGGHFSLSYPFFIPWIWLLIIRIKQDKIHCIWVLAIALLIAF